jgi:hypothetical protein
MSVSGPSRQASYLGHSLTYQLETQVFHSGLEPDTGLTVHLESLLERDLALDDRLQRRLESVDELNGGWEIGSSGPHQRLVRKRGRCQPTHELQSMKEFQLHSFSSRVACRLLLINLLYQRGPSFLNGTDHFAQLI